MRVYPEDALETLRARKFLEEWKTEGFLTDAQYERLAQDTPTELRSTNTFLRIVLFFFTILCVAAAGGLWFVLFQPAHQATSVLFLIFAILCYGAAEFTVREAGFYHHGIEEALTVCSIGYLCAGVQSIFGYSSTQPHDAESLLAAVGAVFSLWIWYRFGLWYTFVLAMVFVVFLPADWTSSPSVQRLIVAACYAIGVVCLVVVRLRSRDRFDYLDPTYSFAEAILWLGLYLTFNLKILDMGGPGEWFSRGMQAPSPFGRTFYWTTWVLIWCLPPVILARGVRNRDRFVLVAGAVVGLLTLVVNKLYLGWPRHTWDPMLLGIVLIGGALWLRRRLQQGPGGVRHGFTAERLSKKDDNWIGVGSSALGLFSPHAMAPEPQGSGSSVELGGGASGGGGASRDF